jgi:hypothetical protein
VSGFQKKKIFLSVALIAAIYIALSSVLSYLYQFNSAQNRALVMAGILGTINVVISFIILFVSFDRGIKEFMIRYFGGMAIRVLFLLIIIFLLLKFMIIDIFVFILSLFVLYFVFQALEIYFVHGYQKRK